jgi:hypothetical protein
LKIEDATPNYLFGKGIEELQMQLRDGAIVKRR